MSRSKRRNWGDSREPLRLRYLSDRIRSTEDRSADSFTCRNCGAQVVSTGAGSEHRNHCPRCLTSVHLDDEPGDRAAYCGGVMEPVAVWVRKGGEWALIHRCRTCGRLSSNRIAADDNEMLLLSVAVRPLSRPPFPLERLGTERPRREPQIDAD